jgi:hypothetical protein
MRLRVALASVASVGLLVGCTNATPTSAPDAGTTPESAPDEPPDAGSTIWVAPTGRDANPGTESKPLATVSAAMAQATPGTVIEVAAGTYSGAMSTQVPGTAGAPITLRGHDAVLTGGGDSGRVLQILHDYWVVEGFQLNGQSAGDDEIQDNAIWIQGAHNIEIRSNEIHHFLGECVRVKYLASDVTIERNFIHDCGMDDFVLSPGDGKSGEGVYIGTAPEQLSRNPTPVPDTTTEVLVRDNVFETRGNECVDIKEAATGNVVEFNDCSQQKDPDSGGFDSRGSGNVYRYNLSHDNAGAGIRLGGDTPSDGLNNELIGNVLLDNAGSGIKVMRLPQGTICGNKIERAGSGEINTDEVTNARCSDPDLPEPGPRHPVPGVAS